MSDAAFVTPDHIRTRFSRTMSEMYRAEVPQYGTLMELVADVNAATLVADPALKADLERTDDLERIDLERHGAIRLGTAEELSTMRRLFAVMGMEPVGYYDLSVAGVPVHSTAFRPVREENLARNPFRVFTSLLRLELIEDEALREEAAAILSRRRIFTPGALALIERFETAGGLTNGEAEDFVREAVETFRWHREATVDEGTYQRLSKVHRLIADVVCFRGPHINHLTPRTLDIDAVQAAMPARSIAAKDVIEGPPTRRCPILLRQTSFKALEEPILFRGADGAQAGTHTARFGEIEQRGLALTRKGRALYDELLARVRDAGGQGNAGADYAARLAAVFADFPDDHETLRREELGYYRYVPTDKSGGGAPTALDSLSLEALIASGDVEAYPIVYEDFLPVSAAGIFQSNLGGQEQRSYAGHASRGAFVEALGAKVRDEFEVYEEAQARSIEAVREALRRTRRPDAA
ncbi:VOC family protein [uncultured Aureimonas sp.]|uniref:2-oxoadipate dioxygenase/decarboxylase HglS n=1 Tax=uncultured Aureimonas sp. TaxID=1604662 RepID=UPI00345BC1EC